MCWLALPNDTDSRFVGLQSAVPPLYAKTCPFETVPTVKLKSLVTLNLGYNNLKDFPDLNSFNANTNTLRNLYLSHNKFYLAENSSERSLTTAIVNKIPAGISNLQLGSTFYGSIDANVFFSSFFCV